MLAQPQQEHKWLDQLVGEWTAEMECVMGPGQEPMKSTGSSSVRSLGGLWTVDRMLGTSPDGGEVESVMTLGYDPAKQKYVGTFVCGVMTLMWLYEGTVSADGTTLTLDTEGPSMAGDGTTARYQDIIEIKSPTHRILRSQSLGPDGNWVHFMTAHYHRKG